MTIKLMKGAWETSRDHLIVSYDQNSTPYILIIAMKWKSFLSNRYQNMFSNIYSKTLVYTVASIKKDDISHGIFKKKTTIKLQDRCLY